MEHFYGRLIILVYYQNAAHLLHDFFPLGFPSMNFFQTFPLHDFFSHSHHPFSNGPSLTASSQPLPRLTRIQLQRLTKLVPVGCRQMTEFFSKTRKSDSPSTLASARAPTAQSCPLSQGKALALSVIDEHHINTISKLLLIKR